MCWCIHVLVEDIVWIPRPNMKNLLGSLGPTTKFRKCNENGDPQTWRGVDLETHQCGWKWYLEKCWSLQRLLSRSCVLSSHYLDTTYRRSCWQNDESMCLAADLRFPSAWATKNWFCHCFTIHCDVLVANFKQSKESWCQLRSWSQI